MVRTLSSPLISYLLAIMLLLLLIATIAGAISSQALSTSIQLPPPQSKCPNYQELEIEVNVNREKMTFEGTVYDKGTPIAKVSGALEGDIFWHHIDTRVFGTEGKGYATKALLRFEDWLMEQDFAPKTVRSVMADIHNRTYNTYFQCRGFDSKANAQTISDKKGFEGLPYVILKK